MFTEDNYISLKEFIEVAKYKITGCSEYQWHCYGSGAFMMDSITEDYSLSVVFDPGSQIVYQVEVWDYNKNREYRWINPIFIKKYKEEAASRGIPDRSSEDNWYIDLDIGADIIEKARAIVNGEEYDTRVQVNIELPEEDINVLMKMAHEQDITLNNLIENILKNNILNGAMQEQLELDF